MNQTTSLYIENLILLGGSASTLTAVCAFDYVKDRISFRRSQDPEHVAARHIRRVAPYVEAQLGKDIKQVGREVDAAVPSKVVASLVELCPDVTNDEANRIDRNYRAAKRMMEFCRNLASAQYSGQSLEREAVKFNPLGERPKKEVMTPVGLSIEQILRPGNPSPKAWQWEFEQRVVEQGGVIATDASDVLSPETQQ